jgi:hypothetical protein
LVADYPIWPRPRDFGTSPHMRRLVARFESEREKYESTITGFLRHVDRLAEIPAQEVSPIEPFSRNDWLPGLDAISLYCFVADLKPRTDWEVGSGHSTRFVRRAINDYSLSTRIVSIDPHPRAEIDQLCDEVHRQGLENVDLAIFDQAEPGDIVFVDNSHMALQNSDVSVFFMEVLGRFLRNMLYALHDIPLPYDYQADWAFRWYNETYLLAACLFGGADGDEIVLPCVWCGTLMHVLAPLSSRIDGALARSRFLDAKVDARSASGGTGLLSATWKARTNETIAAGSAGIGVRAFERLPD